MSPRGWPSMAATARAVAVSWGVGPVDSAEFGGGLLRRGVLVVLVVVLVVGLAVLSHCLPSLLLY